MGKCLDGGRHIYIDDTWEGGKEGRRGWLVNAQIA